MVIYVFGVNRNARHDCPEYATNPSRLGDNFQGADGVYGADELTGPREAAGPAPSQAWASRFPDADGGAVVAGRLDRAGQRDRRPLSARFPPFARAHYKAKAPDVPEFMA
ncbi:hypothetical protein ACTMTI_51000 [Nonomuraea sp. H19]|uniref:hypothetical protein n=1 Tax=Nonomuraea sp. H19 TaxID=3452206 RepID=UPI003F89F740